MVDQETGTTSASLRAERDEKLLIGSGASFCIRLMVNYATLCEGDLNTTAVFLSIALGSTQHLRNLPVSEDTFDGPFHRDDLRRPMSISAIARSLNLPVETVRRKCVRLAELDMVERTPTGHVIVTSRILARPEIEAVVRDGTAAMRLLMDQVRRMG